MWLIWLLIIISIIGFFMFFKKKPYYASCLESKSAHYLIKQDIKDEFYENFIKQNSNFFTDSDWDLHIYLTEDNKILLRKQKFGGESTNSYKTESIYETNVQHHIIQHTLISETIDFQNSIAVLKNNPYSEDSRQLFDKLIDQALENMRVKYLLSHIRLPKFWKRK